MNPTQQRITGACFCGNVHFALNTPIKWAAHCHCTMCRRIHGAAFVTWLGIAAEQCTLDERDVIWYSSSPDAERGRCRHCASQIFFRSKRWPGELHIALAALHDPHSIKPQAHVFYADAVNWFEQTDHLPKFATVPSDA